MSDCISSTMKPKSRISGACPYCGEITPYAVRIRERQWENEIRVAKLIDTAAAMLRWMKNPENFYGGLTNEEDYRQFEERLAECGVSVDD